MILKLNGLLGFFQCDKCWHRSALVVEKREEISKENNIIRKKEKY
ncbi:MAG: hypothetical protein E6638_07605 [Clostridium perfringens]|nr:hypothetical protein [Clostridium perfringens]MDU6174992.1 hypothetical protein [Clostridium perfringens]